jgi:glycosyltransferase involved in cell wall biosynthesis
MNVRWAGFSVRNYFYFGVNTLQNLLLKAGFGEPLIYSDRRSGHRIGRTFDNRLTILTRPAAISHTPKLSVIVPVYNERTTFSQLIDLVLNKQIENVDIEVIIVESNSTDGTREDVLKCREHPRVKVILEDRPKGKGHAVRAGLQQATGDVILIQDADLEYDINEYEALIAPILAFEQNFVIGSRHKGLGGTWKIRKFSDSAGLSHFFNFGHLLFLTLFNRIYRQNLADPFSMFKVFRRDCLYGLEFECNRFDFDFEIAIKLIRKGYKPVEIPINYQSRSIAEGKKVTMIRDPLTWLRALLKFRSSPLYRTRT